MSVPSYALFEVTKSQLLDWGQTGRLYGASDARVGQWIVVQYGSRFGKPMHYVKVVDVCDSLLDADTVCGFVCFPIVGALGYDFEVWHVVRGRRGTMPPAREFGRVGIDLREALRQLRAAGEIMPCGCAYCGGSNDFGAHICRGPVGYYCVCGACYSIPQLRHGMAVV